MKKSSRVLQKKPGRGRPTTRAGNYDPVTTIRLPRDLDTEIDAWRKANDVRSRSAAICRLVQLGLKAKK